MLGAQIQRLIECYRDCIPVLHETHISWVILLGDDAYKIKKPVTYSFLDFSTIEKRRQACHREVLLNRRLAPWMYLGVEPICQDGQEVIIGKGRGTIIDHAVKMRRLDPARHMPVLLREGNVTKRHMQQIAEQLIIFHTSTNTSEACPDASAMLSDFRDLLSVEQEIRVSIGDAGITRIHEAIAMAETVLAHLTKRIRQRFDAGLVVDGHGDLHSGNIFLLDEPVIFDCIEFNDRFRQVDILDELAFFCLDLDLHGRPDLAAVFLEYYCARHRCMTTGSDAILFNYYRLYRANVKIKVQALKGRQAPAGVPTQQRYRKVKAYFDLLEKYLDDVRFHRRP